MALEFKLYPPQKAALMTEAKEILYGGSLGGGKSHLIRVATIIYSLQIPGLMSLVLRRTFSEVLANYIHTPGGYLELLAEMIDAGDCSYSKSDYSINFFNGSRIQLGHCQYESDVYRYQGGQYGLICPDESTHFTPMMIRFLRSRLRLGSMKVPEPWTNHFPRMIYASNPGGVGHLYFKSNFVDHGENVIFKAPVEEGSMDRIFIPAKLADNKVLLENDKEYAQRVRGMGDSATVSAMLDGNWDSLSVGGFGDVWQAKTHVVTPFPVPHTWTITRSFDYGYSAPSATIWVAEADGEEFSDGDGEVLWVPKGTLFIVSELYLANARLEGLRLSALEQGERMRSHEQDEKLFGRVQPGPADNSIFNREGGASIADDLAKSNMTFIRSNKSAGSRILGVQIMRTLLTSATRRPLENPGIFVFRNCYHVIRTIPNLSCDLKNPEDIDSCDEDHLWDTVRYKILSKHKKGVMSPITGV